MDLSRTSQPMIWNCVPRKVVTPAAVHEMAFIKPSHSAKDAAEGNLHLSRVEFDPRRIEDKTLDVDARRMLLESVSTSVPKNGLQHFWEKSPYAKNATTTVTSEDDLQQQLLWDKHVIFWHEDARQVDALSL